MLLGNKQIKLGEVRYFTIDYTKWLMSNETVTQAVAQVGPTTTPPLDATTQLATDSKVTVQVSGGVAGTQYTVEVTATTLVNNTPDPNGSQTKIDCFGIDLVEECVA